MANSSLILNGADDKKIVENFCRGGFYLHRGLFNKESISKAVNWLQAQKPEALIHRIILATTNKGDSILDPFLGTGTTAIVAKKMKRKFIGSEILKDYCKIAKRKLNEVGTLV